MQTPPYGPWPSPATAGTRPPAAARAVTRRCVTALGLSAGAGAYERLVTSGPLAAVLVGEDEGRRTGRPLGRPPYDLGIAAPVLWCGRLQVQGGAQRLVDAGHRSGWRRRSRWVAGRDRVGHGQEQYGQPPR